MLTKKLYTDFQVALRKESVDRNEIRQATDYSQRVALRKESVDRNWGRIEGVPRPNVALRKESVDRNSIALANIRAYIVALRKESVDRNSISPPGGCGRPASLSARRAWIEIASRPQKDLVPCSRSPQGERG